MNKKTSVARERKKHLVYIVIEALALIICLIVSAVSNDTVTPLQRVANLFGLACGLSVVYNMGFLSGSDTCFVLVSTAIADLLDEGKISITTKGKKMLEKRRKKENIK